MFVLAVLLLSLHVPTPDTSLVRTYDLATLTAHQARQLDGHPVRVTFTADTLTEHTEDGDVVEAEGPDDESRTIHFAPGETAPAIGERAVVEGFLRVVRHRQAVHDGITFPGFVEIKVVEARFVRP